MSIILVGIIVTGCFIIIMYHYYFIILLFCKVYFLKV